jgi:hypothetical protein
LALPMYACFDSNTLRIESVSHPISHIIDSEGRKSATRAGVFGYIGEATTSSCLL